MKKFGKFLLAIAIVFASLGTLIHGGLKVWGNMEDSGEIPHVVENALATFFKPFDNKKIKEFKEMMGGTACGICHPENDDYNIQLIKEANITWVRFDIPSESPYVFNPLTGEAIKVAGEYVLTQSYLNFKARCKLFQDQGIKVMGITPYVDDMLEEVGALNMFKVGGDSYPAAFETLVKEVSAFYAEDLKGYVNCFQISNELTIDKWMGALTLDQICYYQGELQMKSMYEIAHNNGIPIGFNLCGYTLYDYPKQMCDTYGDYFDYVALDLYLGCFENSYHTTIIYDLLLRNLYNLSGCKPVMLNEFGYISDGRKLTDEEKAQYLNDTYGEEFNTEQKIRDNIVAFLTVFENSADRDGTSSPMTEEARRLILANGGENNPDALKAAADYVLSQEQITHLYSCLPEDYYLTNYEHSQEGQAKFFKELVSRLSSMHFMCGFFAYMYSDSDDCYQCGGPHCPQETAWGLVTLGTKHAGLTPYNSENVVLKPSYYAIQEVYGKIGKLNEKYSK